MNILFYSLIIFVISYLLLKFIANASTKKISNLVRILILISAFILAIIFAFGGRFLLSLPLILLSLGIVKLKGLTIYQADWAISNVVLGIDDVLYQLKLKAIPEIGEQISLFGFTLEVRGRQKNRITLLRVLPPSKPEDNIGTS